MVSSLYYGSMLTEVFPRLQSFENCFLIFSVSVCLLWASLVAQMVKNLPPVWETWAQLLGQEEPLEKGRAAPRSPCRLHWCPHVLFLSSFCSLRSAVFGSWWLRAVAHQAPLSMEFSRQEYWNELPFPTPGDLPKIEPTFLAPPALAGLFLATVPSGKLLSSKAVLTQIYSVTCEAIAQDSGAIVIWLIAYYIDLKIHLNYFCRFII